MNKHLLKTVGLTRKFGTTFALDKVDLSVSPGTILTLLGPNGAGKTTLLRLLVGMIEPTSGNAFLGDAPVRSMPRDMLGQIAYVGDQCEPPRNATLSMLEALQAGASPRFDSSRFRALCERQSLSFRRPFGSLSKGQRRWALTSLALASRPRVILFDEPADGMDPSARRALYDSLRDHVNETDAAVIVTTHIIADVERISDEVAILVSGRLVLHAPLEELRESVSEIFTADDKEYAEAARFGKIIGQSRVGEGGGFVWLKVDGWEDDDFRRRLGPTAEVRRVNLETLYLAVAEHREPPVASDEQEVAS